MTSDPPIVLVVDDEEDQCHNLADILGDVGFRVDVASDGATALAMARRRAYDVALVDLKMPGMNGLELCRALRDQRPLTVSILVTAFGGTLDPATAAEAGAWHVLAKPLDLRALLNRVVESSGRPPEGAEVHRIGEGGPP